MTRVGRPAVRTLALACGLLTWAGHAHTQDEAGDLSRVVTALALAPGSIVAEIGAGDGALTLGLARHVGAQGRVFTTELGEQRLQTLRAAIAGAALTHVDVVEGLPTGTNLVQGCCDAIVMRDVYHHFGNPSAMNASLLASLKPGGRMAILDFTPAQGQESETAAGRSRDGHHGVGRKTVSQELERAGFEDVSIRAIAGRRFMVTARKPVSVSRTPV